VDLSFARWERDQTVTALPTELAVLLVGVAARQAASPTARIQAQLGLASVAEDLLAPLDGAFSSGTAETLTRWQGE